MTEPDRPGGLMLAEHFLQIGQPDRVLEALDRTGDDALQQSDYWGLRASALLELDRNADALDAARAGLRIDADDPWLLSLASRAASELGDLAEAERLVLAALRPFPEDAELLCQYALLLARGGQAGKAAAVLERAEQLDPDHPTVLRTRAVLAFLTGDDRSARRHSERVLAEHDAEDPAARAVLGATASSRGSAGVASRHLDEVARYDVRDHAAAELAREARIEAHWLFWPMRPITRFGPGPVWLVAIGVGFALRAAGFETLSLVWIAAYIVYVAYSWIAPPLGRRFLTWRMR